VVVALGKIGDTSAVEPLIEALKDDTGAVQKVAAEALGKIGDSNGVKALELFGRKKRAEESGQGRGTSTVKQELQRQRENTERCLTILTRCRTRYEIIEGLRQIETLLKQVNDPLADAAGRASVTCRTMSDKFVL
jgi:hypothetical protein